ncbi:MAG: alpha/beta hydrolase family protein [Hyphomonadaceae bacterium]
MRGLIAALAVTAWSSCAAAQEPPGAEIYGALPAISDAAISPDGSRIVIAVASAAGEGVRVLGLDGMYEMMAAAAPQRMSLRAIGWADDEHAVFTVSQTLRPEHAFAGVIFPGNPRYIEYFSTGIAALPSNRWFYIQARGGPSGVPQFFWDFEAPIEGDPGRGRATGYTYSSAASSLAVFAVDLSSGRAGVVARGSPDTLQFILNERGEVAARIDVQDAANSWRILRNEGGRYVEALSGDSDIGAPPIVAGFLADGRLALIDNLAEHDRDALIALDLASGERRAVFEDSTYALAGAIADPWTRRVVGAAWTADFPRQLFFEAELQQSAEELAREFVGGYAQIVSWSRDRRRLLVFGERATDAGGFYLYEPGAGTMRLIAMRYPALSGPAAVGERQAVTYPARDGVRIPAYLTLPAGAPRRDLPLVLLVHGGPHSRDTFAWDWWASFLASRGYAVLQPNFRGSDGYGRAWRNAGLRQWGGLMQTDAEDGVAALVRAGIVDPARVCIVGASYGGYAALAGAALTPERYACAASVSGVSDLEQMLAQVMAQTGRASIASDFWRVSIGDRAEDRERIRAVSPVNLAANVRAPILLMHGDEDTVVPIEQSRRMERALREAGRDVRFVTLTGDDHWLSRAETRTQMLRELESFLAQHLLAAQ